ncbi:hypothetical protein RFI_13935, partial [Reticulomyxa filosa]
MSGQTEKKPLVLVTGATGFIAGHVIKQLVERGYRVRGTVRNNGAQDKHKPIYNLSKSKGDIELVECDLSLDKNWDKAVEGCEYVLHTATVRKTYMHAGNKAKEDIIAPVVEGTRRILEACLKSKTVKKFVYTGSGAAMNAFGWNNHPRPRDVIYVSSEVWTDLTKPMVTDYAKSKVLAEQLAFDFVKTHNYPFQVVSICPAHCFGPLLYPRLPNCMLPTVFAFSPVHPISSTHVILCDVRDVALAHVNALTSDKANGNRYLIASDSLWEKDIAK